MIFTLQYLPSIKEVFLSPFSFFKYSIDIFKRILFVISGDSLGRNDFEQNGQNFSPFFRFIYSKLILSSFFPLRKSSKIQTLSLCSSSEIRFRNGKYFLVYYHMRRYF